MAQTVDAGHWQDGLIYILRRMEQIFQQLEVFSEVPPPQSVKDKNQDILLVVLSVLTSVTENITQGPASKFVLGGYTIIYSPLIRKIFEKAARQGCHRGCIAEPWQPDTGEGPDGDCSSRWWRYLREGHFFRSVILAR